MFSMGWRLSEADNLSTGQAWLGQHAACSRLWACLQDVSRNSACSQKQETFVAGMEASAWGHSRPLA